jgi:hypothetical protein
METNRMKKAIAILFVVLFVMTLTASAKLGEETPPATQYPTHNQNT